MVLGCQSKIGGVYADLLLILPINIKGLMIIGNISNGSAYTPPILDWQPDTIYPTSLANEPDDTCVLLQIYKLLL